MKLSTPCLLALALALAAALPAAAAQTRGWYAGISGGQSRTSNELVTNRETTLVNASDIRSTSDDRDSAWKILGGYRINEMLAVEVNYANLGRVRTSTSFTTTGTVSPGSIDIERKISGFGADLVLSAPVGQQFSIFGRAGAFRSRLEAAAELTGNINFSNGDPTDRSRSTQQDETVFRFGAGGEWWVRPNVALRLEWERYNNVGKAFAIGGSGTTGEANTDAISLGVVMRF